MNTLLKFLIFFLGVFTHSVTGFGSGLISMAFLPGLIPIVTAAPVVALLTTTIEVFLLLHFRSAFNLKNMRPVILASLFGIPIGVWALRGLSEGLLLRALGMVMAGYALYALLNFRLPELKHPAWAYVFGFLGGILSGAYSVGGPPVIIYGNCRRWEPAEFKSNLQGIFLINDAITITTHFISGNLTPTVWQVYLLALPAIGLGILSGAALDRYINPNHFRKLALGLLVIMGLRLMFIS